MTNLDGPPHKVIERLSLVAPLGMRFWDGATNEFAGSGLMVTAYPVGQKHRRVTATMSSAGVYGFVSLPGLRQFENGAGDAAYWAALPSPRAFTIEVIDRERRFLPLLFTVTAPTQGAAGLWCGSPLSPLEFIFPFPSPLTSPLSSPLSKAIGGIPLFSAPQRTVAAGMAVMRAQLWEVGANRAAAWAMVEASPPGQMPVYGLADEMGRLTLIFPYPRPQRPPLASPLASPLSPPSTPYWLESWTIGLRAFYGALPVPEPPLPENRAEKFLGPDLCDILAQPAATLLESASPLVPLNEATLRYGEEMIVRSEGMTNSSLLIMTV